MTKSTMFSSLVCLSLSGCGSLLGTDDVPMGTGGADSVPSADSPNTGGGPGQGNGPNSPNGSDTTSADESDDGDIVLEPDGSPVSFECDPYAQNCPKGEKCMPWANDGGGSWNATHCSDIVDNPNQLDEECMAIDHASSGADTCDLGLMCWGVDLETNLGVCVAMCSGSAANPICEPEGTGCSVANDGAVVLCLPTCDPLAQDCGPSQGCYPIGDAWSCVPNASNEGGGYGEPCAFINVCNPGLVCVDAVTVPNCTAGACCSELCDTSDPAGDAQCTGAPQGQFCASWYGGGAPSGFEDLGICTLTT